MRASYFLMMLLGLGMTVQSALAIEPLPDNTIPGSFGVAAHYNTPAYNPAYNNLTFDRLAQMNVGLMRFLPDWQTIEKVKGVYDFTTVDWLTSSFRSRGMRPIICLGLNNPLYGVNTRINTQAQREAFGR